MIHFGWKNPFLEIFVEEVIFFGLDDLILEQEEFINGKPKSQTCCKPATRTYCIAARETVWKTFEEPETGVLGNRFIIRRNLNFS